MSRSNGHATGVYSGTTIPGYVETDEGLIPYIEVMHDGGILYAPVCVQKQPRGAPCVARNRAGKVLYALPGGGRMPA